MRGRHWVTTVCLVAAGCAASGGRQESDAAGGASHAVEGAQPAATGDASAAARAEAAIEKGDALMKQGRIDDAEQVYRAAIKAEDLLPHHRATLFLRMSHVMGERGKLENALEYANGALAMRPDWDDAEETVHAIEKKLAAARERAAATRKKKLAAGAAGAEGDEGARAAKAAKRKKADAAAAGQMSEEDALRAKCTDLKAMVAKLDADRGALKGRVAELEEETQALRAKVADLQAQLGAREGK